MSTVPPQRGSGVGPIALLLPIFALLAFTLWRQAGGGMAVGQRSSTDRPPSARIERVVDGWAGSFTVPGAAAFVVEARLAPLHALPERQAFDAAALARQLRLPEGEPWRLALTARGIVPAEVPAEVPAQVPGEVPAAAPASAPQTLPLDALTLSGFQGLVEPVVGQGGDPLRALLAPPRGGLAPGQRVDLLFWRPLAGGVAAGGAGEPTACTLSARLDDTSLEVVLTPTRLAEPGTSASLARLPKASREERGR